MFPTLYRLHFYALNNICNIISLQQACVSECYLNEERESIYLLIRIQSEKESCTVLLTPLLFSILTKYYFQYINIWYIAAGNNMPFKVVENGSDNMRVAPLI